MSLGVIEQRCGFAHVMKDNIQQAGKQEALDQINQQTGSRDAGQYATKNVKVGKSAAPKTVVVGLSKRPEGGHMQFLDNKNGCDG